MRTIARMVAAAGLVASAVVGGTTAAYAGSTGIQSEGEVACGYDYGTCWTQWYDYGFVKNYVVGEIYYRGGGYHFYWWN